MSNPCIKPGEFCWNELMTPNTQQAKTFYCDLFGWQAVEEDIGHMIYTLFKNGEKNIGGMLQTPENLAQAGVPSHWMSYISVDNVDTMLEKAAKLGANIKMPATPIKDFGKFAVLEDPTGACFAIWENTKS